MTERSTDAIAAEQLTQQLMRQLQQSDPTSMAVSGAFQAVFANCCGIAIIELLKQKLGVSDRDVELALSKAYRDEADRRRNKGQLQIAQEIPQAIRKPA